MAGAALVHMGRPCGSGSPEEEPSRFLGKSAYSDTALMGAHAACSELVLLSLTLNLLQLLFRKIQMIFLERDPEDTVESIRI